MRSAVPAQEVLQQIAQDVEDATSPGSRGRASGRRNEVGLGALADHLGYSVRRLQVWIFQDFVRALAPFDIRPAQYSVLIVIEANPGLSQTALAQRLGIERDVALRGVHIHVPAGATPKDGPSAGVTMATALASAYTGKPARSDTAMTGEITLSGLVLPVGGIKEKLLAAHRAQIKRIILPAQNEPDLEDLPEHVREEMDFTFAERIEDVLTAAIPELALAGEFVH